MRYATAPRGDAESVYRSVDAASRTGGANPHQLVELMYEELVRALRVAGRAAENQQFELKSARVTKALAILFALEGGLDHERGGSVAETLSNYYRGARQALVKASLGTDPRPFVALAEGMEEIAGAWRMVRAAH